MKTTKRIRALLLCALFLVSVLAMCACGKRETKAPKENELAGDNGSNAVYKVTVVDGSGQPYTEKIIVKFMQNGTQVAMTSIDANGVAQKELPKGEYTLEIATTESSVNFWFDKESAVLTAEKTEIQVTLVSAASGEATSITATVPGTETSKEYDAYNVDSGSTFVSVTAGDRTYVIFVPTEAGVYQVSVDGDAQLGYYGAPHFVQPLSLAEIVDNSFTVSVNKSSISEENTGTARYVIGLDAAEGVEGVMLNITRIGDPEWTIEDEPWSRYQNKWEITDYTLPEGVTLKKFELTAPSVAYKLVLNETDRCYHLNSADGKLVFVQLEKDCYGISLKNMVGEIIIEDGVVMQSGSAPFRYMYNNGKDDFFKEDYTDAMRQFVTKRDAANGVYPLTEDLYYMLQKGIEFMGWCDPNSSNYRFAELPGVNNEISWLFLCEYVDGGNVVLPLPEETENYGGNTDSTVIPGPSENTGTTGDTGSTGTGTVPSNPIHDNKDEPIEVGGTLQFDAQVQPGHLVYYALYKVTDTTLTINNSNAYVIYKGKTYKPVNGVVTVPNLYSANSNVPVKLSIGNMGTSAQNYNVTLSYPQGHQMNPYKLSMGSNSTYSAKDNSQGVYYTFTASKAGTLTIRLDSVSGDNNGNISITSTKTDGGTRSVNLNENANSDGRSVSFKLSAGETVTVIIGVSPSSGFDYPEATITTTASFA